MHLAVSVWAAAQPLSNVRMGRTKRYLDSMGSSLEGITETDRKTIAVTISEGNHTKFTYRRLVVLEQEAGARGWPQVLFPPGAPAPKHWQARQFRYRHKCLFPRNPAAIRIEPFERLVIRGGIWIDGTGAPPFGPVDIVIENNVITEGKVVSSPHVAIDPGGRPAKDHCRLDGYWKAPDELPCKMVPAAFVAGLLITGTQSAEVVNQLLRG